MTNLDLHDGRSMPQLGMGTWQIPDSQVAAIVRRGIDLGFRLIDTAAIYKNERGVGEGLKGEDVFVTTKLWNDDQGDPHAAMDASLALLGLEQVDLYLMHWPAPGQGQYVDAWKAMIKLRDAGKTRSIGVSNFLPEHIERIVAETGEAPVLNQIELHPRWQQRETVAYHRANGIVTQSWSPIGQGKGLLDDPAIRDMAERLGRSPAQVVIAWHMAKGFSVIPKASSAEHLSDNFAAADVTLSAEDVAAIDTMDSPDGRLGPDPRSM